MDILPELLWDIWKKGKTLSQSIDKFCDAELLRAYDDIELKKDYNNKNSSENNWQSVIGGALKEVSELNYHSQNKKDALDKLKLNLLNKIISEKLIGLGYEAPIKSADYPKIIPLHIWPHKINEIKVLRS